MNGMRMRISGLDTLIQRVADARPAIARAIETSLDRQGEWTVELLSDAAPKGSGSSSSSALEGDAGGALSESFFVRHETPNLISVMTSQPTKMGYVTQGTGLYGPHHARITPRFKRALAWEGAEHPVRSVRGILPNPFHLTPLDEARQMFEPRVSTAVRDALRALGL